MLNFPLLGKKVLVTGAGGFIGSHLTEFLVTSGCDVTALAHYNSKGDWGWLEDSNIEIRNSIDVRLGDVRDANFVMELVKGHELVFNLAALIAIPYSYSAIQSYIETNVLGTLNVALATKATSSTRLVQVSTSEVYGSAQFVPINEEHPLNGQSPYAASKIGADQLAMSFFHSFNTPVTIVRPFNTFGPRQSARAVIPTIITQIASGRRSIELGSLEPTRDFTFVSDTVCGIATIGACEAAIGSTFNLGTGFEISIGETAELLKSLMDRDVIFQTESARCRPAGSEVDRLCSDNSKALQICNWSPVYRGINGLKESLNRTIDWFCEPVNLSHYKTDIYNL